MGTDTGRRLCLLFEAGPTRYAVEATAVVEVSPPDADGDKLRGVFEVRDLSALVGGAPEARPGLVVVLDVSPTLAVRVRRVVEVADVAAAPFFNLPPRLSERLGRLVRGALLHGERLYLELHPEALVQEGPMVAPAAPPAPPVLAAATERALLFESGGGLHGIALPLVLQVVPAGQSFCPLPVEEGPVVGLLSYGNALWPVYSVAGLQGERGRTAEPLFILAELAGHHVAFTAQQVLGVHAGLTPTAAAGAFEVRALQRAALFLDFQRIFS